jgi:hypothetical protein
MPADNKATEFLSGKIYWAKVFDVVPNYGGDAREWTFEFEPDADGLKVLKKHKLTDRLKDKENPDRKVMRLKKPEFNRNGEANKPIRIYDNDDDAWDPKRNDKGEPTNLIGNGSAVDVKLDIRDYGVGKKSGVYPLAIRVTNLEEFQRVADFGGFKEDRPKDKPEDNFKKDFGLPDDNDLDDELAF